MGTLAPRLVTAPDGTRMPAWQFEGYMQNNYLPTTDFAASATAPIPGLTGPTMPGAQIPGMQPPAGMPPPGTPQMPSFATPFQSNGQYGLLAQQLAGVGGPNAQIPQQPAPAQGLLGPGPKRGGFRIPGGK
jgi:hypothetical protein